MSTVLCDLGAWIVYASRAPFTVIPKEEAAPILRDAACGARQAEGLCRLPAFQELLDLAHWLAETPRDRRVVPDLLVTDDRRRHGSGACRPHLSPKGIGPFSLLRMEGPFAEAEEPLYVVPPDLYLLMRARELDVTALAMVATTLCSTYVPRPDLGECPGRREPLVGKAVLEGFSENLPARCQGASTLRRALAITAEGSRSPMETALSVGLSAPGPLGGYGLPLPRLNHRVDIPRELGRLIGGQRTMYLDLCWPEAGWAVEYDSAAHHSEGCAVAKDRRRRAVADALGISIVPWTTSRWRTRSHWASPSRASPATWAARSPGTTPSRRRDVGSMTGSWGPTGSGEGIGAGRPVGGAARKSFCGRRQASGSPVERSAGGNGAPDHP